MFRGGSESIFHFSAQSTHAKVGRIVCGESPRVPFQQRSFLLGPGGAPSLPPSLPPSLTGNVDRRIGGSGRVGPIVTSFDDRPARYARWTFPFDRLKEGGNTTPKTSQWVGASGSSQNQATSQFLLLFSQERPALPLETLSPSPASPEDCGASRGGARGATKEAGAHGRPKRSRWNGSCPGRRGMVRERRQLGFCDGRVPMARLGMYRSAP